MARAPPGLASPSPWQPPLSLALVPKRGVLGFQPSSLPLTFPNPSLWILLSQMIRGSGPGALAPSPTPAPQPSWRVPLHSAKLLNLG